MKLLKGYLKLLLLICLSYFTVLPTLKAQGPWLEKKGSGFVQMQTTLPLGGRYNSLILTSFDEPQAINRSVFQADFSIYGLYGISDKLTVIAHLPLKYVDVGATRDSLPNPVLLEEGSLFGMNNLYFAAKYKILDKSLKAAVSVQTSWNTASSDLDNGLATGYLANFFGVFAHLGGGLTPKLYAFADIGYSVGTNGYSDYTSLYLEAGYKVAKPLYLIGHLSIKNSARNGDFDNSTLIQTGLYPNDQDWIGWGGRLMYEAKNGWGITLGSAGAIDANYVGLVKAITVGAFKKWGLR